MSPGSVSQGVQGYASLGMAERGEGNGGCNRGDGLLPGTGNGGCNRGDDCRQCLERLVSKVVDLGWMDKHLRQVTCPSNSHSNNKQMCHRTWRDLQARQTWMQVVKVSGAGMSTRKHARNARTGTAWFGAQWIPNNKRICNRIRKRVY